MAKSDLRARQDATISSAAERMGDAISAWAEEERNRVSRQKLTGGSEKLHGGLVSAARGWGLNSWAKFKVFQPLRGRTPSKTAVDTRWALSPKVVDGEKYVKARLVVNGYQGPDLKDSSVETPGCVSLRASHLQVAALGFLENGVFRFRAGEMPFCDLIALGGMDFFALLWNGDSAAPPVLGNCIRRRMA